MLSRTPHNGQRPSAFQHSPLHERSDVMQIQLVRKLAAQLDGIDVSMYEEGDVIELGRREAELLIAERWAVPYYPPAGREVRSASNPSELATAADRVERR